MEENKFPHPCPRSPFSVLRQPSGEPQVSEFEDDLRSDHGPRNEPPRVSYEVTLPLADTLLSVRCYELSSYDTQAHPM